MDVKLASAPGVLTNTNRLRLRSGIAIIFLFLITTANRIVVVIFIVVFVIIFFNVVVVVVIFICTAAAAGIVITIFFYYHFLGTQIDGIKSRCLLQRCIPQMTNSTTKVTHDHVSIDKAENVQFLVIFIPIIKPSSNAAGPKKEISTLASIEGWDQVTPVHYMSRINKTERKFICRWNKANFGQARSTKSRKIAWFLAEPTDPKKIHAPGIFGTRNH
ncbi:LOW QUALITY PROTEIN: hypothetical protein CVT25_010518 [Psilocybe cyanescens]|uniref:Uncharacterized protein n=1 Tax=Psilocybe cyanescens TaxID=93625 RepID=A0A409XP35_PSICY|nr:LOW QUALITY PROTEIN: hypothetical protein CVT25_010518 [Psilocybe cyanescens]